MKTRKAGMSHCVLEASGTQVIPGRRQDPLSPFRSSTLKDSTPSRDKGSVIHGFLVDVKYNLGIPIAREINQSP